MSEILRDRWDRPLVVLPDGSGTVPYKRASSLGKPLDDPFFLTLWKMRKVAEGMAKNPHLSLLFAAADTKGKQNKVVEQALAAAGADERSDVGTALHALTESIDRGATPEFIPREYVGDINAYLEATAHFEHDLIEQFVVCDELRAAGTPDRVSKVDGEHYIVDLKTGSSVDYPHAFAVQLAVYANGVAYNGGKRTALPVVSKERALLIHLPAGQGKCTLHWLDIKAGMEAARLSLRVDEWRKNKKLTWNYEGVA